MRVTGDTLAVKGDKIGQNKFRVVPLKLWGTEKADLKIALICRTLLLVFVKVLL